MWNQWVYKEIGNLYSRAKLEGRVLGLSIVPSRLSIHLRSIQLPS